MVAVLDAATRESDLVVVDLARRLDPAAHAVLRRSRRTVLVVPAEVRAAAAAGLIAAELESHAAEVGVVVRGPAPTGLTAEEVADALGLPLLGELRPEPGLAARLDRGEPPANRARGPLAVLSRRLVAQVLAR
jgi:hypothetical protein